MYLRDVGASCLRRWPVLLAALLVSAGLCVLAVRLVGPTYESEASVVLVPPVNRELPEENRFLGLGGLKQTADVLARSMSSTETVERIQDEHPTAEYEVLPDWATSAPVLTISTSAEDGPAAEAALSAVLDQLPRNLARLQESVDITPANQITQVVVSLEPEPQPVQRTRIRVLGLLAVALLGTSILLTGAVDGLLLRRSRRSSRHSSPPERAPEQ